MKTVVATGVTSGLGLHALRQLIERDDGPYNVIASSRRPEASQAAASELLATRKSSKTTITYVPLDLLSVKSIEKFASAVKDKLGAQTKIDILLLCAGTTSDNRDEVEGVTGQKVESIFFVNTHTPALLTRRLLNSLAPNARVALVSSDMHLYTPQDMTPRMVDDYISPTNWTGLGAYKASKLILCHFGLILRNDREFSGPGRTVVLVHPGLVTDTNLVNASSLWERFLLKWVFPYIPGVSVCTQEQAGEVVVRGMTDPILPNGGYLTPVGVAQYATQLDKVELRQQWKQYLAEQGVW
ncbi:NAD(P)-binding protein [Clavulina sp. PMI_390]|nr:NAD(P)-binding protein [Clavulina sp. PMI_390]